MIRGIDVSSYQASDYPTRGYDFVIVKATEGRSYLNPKQSAQAAHGRGAGLVLGFYHFLWPGNIKAQAAYFVEKCASRPGDVLACDWEHTGSGTAASNGEKDAFIREVKRLRPGHRVLLYCNRDFWLNRDTTSYAGDGLWIAQYNGDPGNPDIRAPWLIHQYTSSPIDTNLADFPSRKAMRAWAAGASTPPEEDDMPEYVGLGKKERQKLTDGVWTSLTWDAEYSDEPGMHGSGGRAFVKGAALYQGTAYLDFRGLPDDGQVQARLVETDAGTGKAVHTYSPGEHGPTIGREFFAFPITGRCKKGRHTVLQVIQHRGEDVTVDGQLKVLVWDRG